MTTPLGAMAADQVSELLEKVYGQRVAFVMLLIPKEGDVVMETNISEQKTVVRACKMMYDAAKVMPMNIVKVPPPK